MSNKEKARKCLIEIEELMDVDIYFAETVNLLAEVLDQHAAEARAEQREKVAAWMIHNGYSTGHGDTIEELLDELKDQVKKSPHDEG